MWHKPDKPHLLGGYAPRISSLDAVLSLFLPWLACFNVSILEQISDDVMHSPVVRGLRHLLPLKHCKCDINIAF